MKLLGGQSCLLLLNNQFKSLGVVAEKLAREAFDFTRVVWTTRGDPRVAELLLEATRERQFDYILNFLSAHIVPLSVCQIAQRDALNFHPGPPKWPGVGSASLALLSGDTTFGVTVNRLAMPIDSGDIVHTVDFPILENEDAHDLFERTLGFALVAFQEVLQKLSADSGPLPPTGLKWARAAVTRPQFERNLELLKLPGDPDFSRKVRAMNFPGKLPPYVSVGDYQFLLRT